MLVYVELILRNHFAWKASTAMKGKDWSNARDDIFYFDVSS